MIVSDTEKAAEAQNRVRDLAGPLVDHDALDRTDLRFIRSVNRSAFDLVAADQTDCLSFFRGHQILLLNGKPNRSFNRMFLGALWSLIEIMSASRQRQISNQRTAFGVKASSRQSSSIFAATLLMAVSIPRSTEESALEGHSAGRSSSSILRFERNFLGRSEGRGVRHKKSCVVSASEPGRPTPGRSSALLAMPRAMETASYRISSAIVERRVIIE